MTCLDDAARVAAEWLFGVYENAAPQDAGRPHGTEGFGDSGLTGSGPAVAAQLPQPEGGK